MKVIRSMGGRKSRGKNEERGRSGWQIDDIVDT